MTRSVLRPVLVAALIGLATGVVVTTAAARTQQTHMDYALTLLRSARHHLDLAQADKGGHRVKAIGLVDQAITEVQAGIQYAASH